MTTQPSTTPSGEIVVTFDRIGRRRNAPELRIPFADVALIESGESDHLWPGDLTNWPAVCDRIYDHVRPMLASRDVDVVVTGDRTRLHGFINVGGFCNGGSFTIAHPDRETEA